MVFISGCGYCKLNSEDLEHAVGKSRFFNRLLGELGQLPPGYRRLIAHLVANRFSGQQRRLVLSRGAAKALQDYWRETEGPGSTRQGLFGHPTLLACKHAVNLHLICEMYSGERAWEISDSLMVSIINITRESVRTTADIVRRWLEEAEQQRIEGRALRLLDKIAAIEPAKPKAVWRKYHVQKKSLYQQELDYLVSKGLVRLKNGLLETISAEDRE